jgi:hypothetical protein
MPIKYGELTIINNKEETTLLTSFLLWLEYANKPPKNSKYIFLFDDGQICDYDDNIFNFNFKFSNIILSNDILYFKKNNHTYFNKQPILNKNNEASLQFKNLFSSYSKYNIKTAIPSIYNCIYYCHKVLLPKEIFGILRIKSNESMPLFQFAYDSDEFTKEEIIYLIDPKKYALYNL